MKKAGKRSTKNFERRGMGHPYVGDKARPADGVAGWARFRANLGSWGYGGRVLSASAEEEQGGQTQQAEHDGTGLGHHVMVMTMVVVMVVVMLILSLELCL